MKLPIPPSRSTNHSLIYLTEGEAIMTIGGETYTIHAHECLVVAAGQIFSFRHPDVNRGYLCTFHSDFVAEKWGQNELLQEFEFLNVWGHPRIPLGKKASALVEPLFQRILELYAAEGIRNPALIQAYMVALLGEIKRAYQPTAGSTPSQAVRLANRFRELLFAHVRTHHRVTDYASWLSITPNHLNKAVKTATGKSASQWIDEALVLEAKVLLHQSTLAISDVAAGIGLLDPSYFSRLFKKHTGTTPLEFRKMIEKS
nr:AraC family transcriptional regulator [Rhabdobacter roseus]